jgi:hypothetical protein
MVVILSSLDDHGCDLGGRVEDGVADAAGCGRSRSFSRGRLLSKSDLLVSGSGAGVASRGSALVTEGVCELLAEPLVLLGQLAVALVGFGEPPQ